jgi:hypothetical protein
MSLTLDLNPTQERDLETLADSEGVPSQAFAQQLFAAALRQKKTFAQLHAKAAADFTASGISEDEVYAYGEQLVKQVRTEMNAQP